MLCRTADADNPPRAARDQSPWVDIESCSSSTVLYRGLARGSLEALAAKLLGDTAHIRVRKMAPSAYQRKEMRTSKSVQGEGKQGICKGQRVLCVTYQAERLAVLR